jgi:hypothetical protein
MVSLLQRMEAPDKADAIEVRKEDQIMPNGPEELHAWLLAD